MILACARTAAEPARIQELLRSDLDWRRFTEAAIEYGVAPLVYSSLKTAGSLEDVPTEALEQLRELHDFHAAQGLNLQRKLQEMLRAFSGKAVPVIVLKGAALAEVVYPSIALRGMRDVDLLVRTEDIDVADRLLGDLGYRAAATDSPRDWYLHHYHHLPRYRASDRTLSVELHHHIIPPPVSARIPIADLWQRARPVEIASTKTLIFSPEDLLLHLCVNLSRRDGFLGKLRAACDIAETIRRYREEMDWHSLVARSRAYGMEKCVYYPLWLARELLDAKVPDRVARSFEVSLRRHPFDDLAMKFVARRALLGRVPERATALNRVVRRICIEILRDEGAWASMVSLSRRVWRRFVSTIRGTGQGARRGARAASRADSRPDRGDLGRS